MSPATILIVRLGAMGDIIHTLPAVAAVRRSFPAARITWLVEPRWRELLDGNPDVDEIAAFDRQGGIGGMWRSARRLAGGGGFDLGIDFQGLIKSASAMRVAGARLRWGRSDARESAARLFYSHSAAVNGGAHIVDQHLMLAGAAGAASQQPAVFSLPSGRAEGTLPTGPFVLASPLAGWVSKQWPVENYGELARRLDKELGIPLVLNVPPGQEAAVARQVGAPVAMHTSSIGGLIDATRRAKAVVGVDSGPLHLAAALAKPGVAIFGPTDPARNGPYGGSLGILRAAGAATTYRREDAYSDAMRAISAEVVWTELERHLRLS